MKKFIFCISLLFSHYTFSQVGINTQNPLGILHIDGAKDNPSSGIGLTSEQQANDFIVTPSGNVGIGTAFPTHKLEIISTTTPAIRIVDGFQKEGYVLMSDADGNGQWRATTQVINANFPPTDGYSGSVGTKGYTNVSINLPPGKWLILSNIVLNATPAPTNGNGVWVRLSWSSSSTAINHTNITAPLNSGNYLSNIGMATGSTIINNTNATTTTYYLWMDSQDIYSYTGTWNNIGALTWKENSIVAYPAN
ncbi:hypothetical protein [Empedobacter falsenii]|uniref:Uncharacterized protein n=1 Tax=Empedobacter falsenii TaxID=343874 RepID=A0AAW7DGW2_9FLAO|nr:hypothetical protein [Empedobacter falsenii]MDM1551201.1 hypothetical protein [Empedobacter falsenii]